MSSMTISSPPDVSEHPKDSRVRTLSRPTPPDLDSIDELDKTNTLSVNLHHKGPYKAVAAILNETNPIDSPLLRQKRAQKQVSSGTRRVRPSRHMKSEPNANPMSLNLQPGQILPNSIYQPTPPTFPLSLVRGHIPRVKIFVSHASRLNIQPHIMTQQILDLHCVAIRLFQLQAWLVAHRCNFIKIRPLATYLNPFLSIVSRPGRQVGAGCLRFLDNPLCHHMLLRRLTPTPLNLQELIALLHTVLLTLICLTTVAHPLKLRLQPLL
ncbi:hypothetical protein V8E53_002409, partial [Lactarius tabidus]